MTDTLIEEFDATPKKSIINALSSDTDRFSAILELIDNSYTSWIQKGLTGPLNIFVDFNNEKRTLKYKDNGGGMNRSELKAFLKPGDTTAEKDHKGISLYGVGSKRSSFFISDTFEVVSRRNDGETLKIAMAKEWLDEQDNWKHKMYRTDENEPNCTILTFQDVKFSLDENYINELKNRISSSFGEIIGPKFSVSVNEVAIPSPTAYEWLFVPWIKPSKHHYKVAINRMNADVTFTVGLLSKSSQIGQYGFDIICNGRLIAKDLRDPEIGFREGELGNPHARFARFKGIVVFDGPVGIMPWNSTKTGIDYSKSLFRKIRERLIMHSKPYTRESNRLSVSGVELPIDPGTHTIELIDHGDVENPKNDYTIQESQRPKLPVKKKSSELTSLYLAFKKYEDLIKKENLYRALIEGIYVSMHLMKQAKFDYRNRYALIIMDNTCELMLKKYIREQKKMTTKNAKSYFDSKDFKNLVEDAKILANKGVDDTIWKRIMDFREKRNDTNHTDPELIVPDSSIKEFREILVHLFDVFFNVDLTAK